MYKNYDIVVDTTQKSKHNSIVVNTNDLKTFKLSIAINQNKKPIDLTGATVRLAIVKPDKTTVFQDCSIADSANGKCEIVLNSQAYLLNGVHVSEVMVYFDSETVAVTGRFSYSVMKGILDGNTLESQNDWQAINKAITDAEGILIDLRENGTGVDAQARADLETVSAELAQKAPLSVFRYTDGTTGSEEAINTVLGYKDNAVAPGVRGAHVQQGSQGNENIVGGNVSTIGTTTPNAVDPAQTSAHYAEVGGYDNVNNALAGLIHAYHCYITELATHGSIYGGSFHKITDGDYAAIVGGTEGFIEYLNGGAYSFIGAGNRNEIFARMSSIIAGMQNRVGSQASNKEYSAIISSYLSSIDGNHAAVIAGNECKATKDYSLARGKGAVANNVGESVFSTGKFKTAGDSGQSTMHLFRQTTDGIAQQLLLDDNNSTITALGVNTTLLLEATITGHRVDAEGHAAFKVTAVVTRGSSGTPVVKSMTTEPVFKSDTAYNADIIATTTGYQVRCQGYAAHTINWTGKLEAVWSRNI